MAANNADRLEQIEERMRAYIWPNVVETDAQREAFDMAVEYQAEYEAHTGEADLPAGVQSVKLGDYTVNMSDAPRWPAYTLATIAPAAWACLKNAGLLRHTMPVARRL